jgi:hypothetical protein
VRSGGDLLVEAEVLFDCGNALKGVIDLFLEAGDILDLFSEIVEIPANRFKFALHGKESRPWRSYARWGEGLVAARERSVGQGCRVGMARW